MTWPPYEFTAAPDLLPFLFLWPLTAVFVAPTRFCCNNYAWGERSVGDRSNSAWTMSSSVNSAFCCVKLEVTERKSDAESLDISKSCGYLLLPPERVCWFWPPFFWLSAEDEARFTLFYYYADYDLPWSFSRFLFRTYSWLPLSISSTVNVNCERVYLGILILSYTTIYLAILARFDTFFVGIRKPSFDWFNW